MEIRLHNNCAEGWLFDHVNAVFKLKTTSANSACHRNTEEHTARASEDRWDLGHIGCALVLAALTAMCVIGCGIGNVQSHHASRATGYHSRLAVGSREQSARRRAEHRWGRRTSWPHHGMGRAMMGIELPAVNGSIPKPLPPLRTRYRSDRA